ncbi:hypothetical protein G2W53_026660 [Senna tora]|uniref:CCHC-type domain-containing protein n=1 Tax=Senna tora TaxID=362788 RepID=A0A834TG28_9FABA|nr:hypothetical protein G2W53_026660 [Senna tora]
MSEAGQENVLSEIEIQSLQPNEEGGSEEHSSGSEGDDEYGESNSDSSDEEDNDLCYRYIDPILEQGVNEDNSAILQYEGDDKYHSEEIHSSIESEDEENEGKKKKKRIKWPQFNERVQYGNVSFELGMEFKNLVVFKQAVRDYTVNKGVQVKFVKNDAKRCRAKCEKPCPWMIMCSWANDTQTFQVKTFNHEHTCSTTMTTQQASSKWLAVKLLPFLRSNSKPDGNDIITYIQETFSLIGLVLAIVEMLPNREHRLCVYHIYSNYAKSFKGLALKDYLWSCARSTIMQEFTCNMNKLKEFNKKAWEFLSRIPPKQWTRAVFDTYSKSQVYTNNMCEQFNSVRDKLEDHKRNSRFWVPQVWDLCGIPCAHAIAALGWRNLKPEDYVHSSLTKETYEKIYESYIQPVNGQNLWQHNTSEEIQPPPIKKKRGRPKTQRKKDASEKEKTIKLKKRLIPTCRNCGGTGHNKRSCHTHGGLEPTNESGLETQERSSVMLPFHIVETQESIAN